MNTIFNPDWCKSLRLSTGEYLVSVMPDTNTVDNILGKCIVLLRPIRVNVIPSNDGGIQVQFLKYNPHTNDNYIFIPINQILSISSTNSEIKDLYLKAFKELMEYENSQGTIQEQAKKKYEQLGEEKEKEKEDKKEEEPKKNQKIIKKGKKNITKKATSDDDYIM